ncbi:MAG: hypothetical protein JWN68_1121 [Nocardioides sp.]|jgi:uncharacterized protein (DUF58 family)|uniref:DUF58 domain-containing protein n=1 Tax=Nocardioides sp. TaxID=35761 RepID=UPI002604B52D|nr:DUF58 domain-containing protein [Nocardioides sp.]MCW2833168.1 hypothetical protein [Nocardioides sp.]
MRALLRGARALLRVPSPTGRAVIALGNAAWIGAAYTQIVELRTIAIMCGLTVLLAIPWLLIPMRVRAALVLQPLRAVAGERVEISLTATNNGRLSLWQPLVSMPVGERDSWLRMPTLPPDGQGSHEFAVDDLERGVLDVGPATAVRSDPLGLLRRSVRWCAPVELFVRPRMVLLSTLGSGQVRDLEGVPSDRMSMSDLAFHALREYVPGDDLRHVHWRSSARAGELLVRQYHDTRRNHATVVLDARATSYRTDDEYELAVSIAASLIMCAAREEYDVSLVSGTEAVIGLPGGTVLDGTCRVQRQRDAEPMAPAINRAVVLVPETSLLFVVTGAGADDLEDVPAGLVMVPAETRCVVLRAAIGETSSMARLHGHDLGTVGSLAELSGMLVASS